MARRPKVTDEQFIQLINACETWEELSLRSGVDLRSCYRRRERLQESGKYSFIPPPSKAKSNLNIPESSHTISDSFIGVIFSDPHWWPGIETPATEIMIKIIKHIKPKYLFANGDLVDGAMISRHARIGWDQRPTPKQELDAVRYWLAQINKAAPKAHKIWTLGNHDLRFDSYLAKNAGPFKDVEGMSLQEQFNQWHQCWSININDNCVIKHRYKGGKHTAYGNAMDSGCSIVTGHTHRLLKRPIKNYKNFFYGVECGTLAEPLGPQFQDYTEHNPLDWHTGFVVIHADKEQFDFELVHVIDGKAKWGGKEWTP